MRYACGTWIISCTICPRLVPRVVEGIMAMRRWLVPLVVIVAFIAGSGLTSVANHAAGPLTYTGCLDKTAGTMSQFKAGFSPLTPCPTGQARVHVGAGDVTGVVAGAGLQGGATGGNVTLSADYPTLDSRYVNTGESTGASAYARVLPVPGIGPVQVDAARSSSVLGVMLVNGPAGPMYCFDLASAARSGVANVEISANRGQFGGTVAVTLDNTDSIFAPCPFPFVDAIAIVRDSNNQVTFGYAFYIVFH